MRSLEGISARKSLLVMVFLHPPGATRFVQNAFEEPSPKEGNVTADFSQFLSKITSTRFIPTFTGTHNSIRGSQAIEASPFHIVCCMSAAGVAIGSMYTTAEHFR